MEECGQLTQNLFLNRSVTYVDDRVIQVCGLQIGQVGDRMGIAEAVLTMGGLSLEEVEEKEEEVEVEVEDEEEKEEEAEVGDADADDDCGGEGNARQ
ncbi:unnamed protein product [Hydatigera taeniaeformis]|uniref:Uncharacterized protein n=1 Tax=Hydatigena taeniaeformis TaxID=6205 RepID=A0A0R3WX51_HYDTA|nr:unnamed protein product [Hydatigera taeniaeformis]